LPTLGRPCTAKTYARADPAPENSGNRRGTPLALRQATVTTMLRLGQRQRDVLADKVPGVMNLITGAIVIGFALGEPRASWPVLVAAIMAWAGALIFALIIAEDKA